MVDLLTPEKEKEVKNLKRKLETWRELLLVLFSVLLWENPSFPLIIIAVLTSVFLFLWSSNLSVLTVVSLILMMATLSDYFVPQLSSKFCPPEQWTAAKEKKFEKMCQSIIEVQGFLCQKVAAIHALKESKPKMYFLVMLTMFSVLAWLGNLVNNLFLTYVFVLLIVLAPGIKRHRIAEKYASKFFMKVADFFRYIQHEKLKRN